MPVVAVAPNGPLLDKLKSNLQEVRARGGRLIVFADGAAGMDDMAGHGIMLRVESGGSRSEEHTSELQSLMRKSYAVFCLKKKRYTTHKHQYNAELTTNAPTYQQTQHKHTNY